MDNTGAFERKLKIKDWAVVHSKLKKIMLRTCTFSAYQPYGTDIIRVTTPYGDKIDEIRKEFEKEGII